jgi:hypothetical protein
MLIRISLIVAILAGIGAIVVTQVTLRKNVVTIIGEREQNAKDRDEHKARADTAEASLTKTTAELKQTQTKLTSAETELATSKTKLANELKNNTTLKEENDRVKAERTEAQQKLNQYEIIGLQPAQIRAVVDELKRANNQIAAIEEEKKIQGRQIKRLENEISKLIGDVETVVMLPAGLKGKVAVVDPKWDFVVLDIGEKNGVLTDGVMMVSRNGRLIGKVKIIRVLTDRSVANVVAGWKLTDIQEGDQVLF